MKIKKVVRTAVKLAPIVLPVIKKVLNERKKPNSSAKAVKR